MELIDLIDLIELIDLIDLIDLIPSRSPDSHCLDLEHAKIAPSRSIQDEAMSNEMGIGIDPSIKGASDVLPSLIRLRTYTLTHNPKHNKLSHSGCTRERERERGIER